MQIEMEFAYQVEVSAPSVRRPGDHVRPVLHWLFGRETVEFRELAPEDFPVAIRRPSGTVQADFVERTDGEQLYSEGKPDFPSVRDKWSRAYSRDQGAWLLRQWFGDGRTPTMDWCPTFEEDFPEPPQGSLIWSGREDARQLLHRRVADCVVMDGEMWWGHGLGIIAVIPPGSGRPGWGPSTKTGVPRVELLTDRYGAERNYMAELAARDLLFYPDEAQQARIRALELGKRIIDLERPQVVERLPRYPDFSVLSMTSWARLLVKRLVENEIWADPVMELPSWEDDNTYRLLRPAELVESIEKLLQVAAADRPRREVSAAFSAVKAAFGATIETNELAQRLDVEELLDIHGRILRRADMRPDRSMERELAAVDEEALREMGEDPGLPAP